MPLTPTLTASELSSDLPTSASDEVPDEVKNCLPRTKIEGLRERGLQEQRRLNKNMACCDYDAVEKALSRGVQGHHGSTQLCLYCLGAETR